jgi:hypothetical protein
MGARLPYALRRGLAKLPDPEPTPAQLRDLRDRLAPLLPHGSRPASAPQRASRSRPVAAFRRSHWRGTIAAALFPIAVAAAVRVASEARVWLHASAPPLHVERAAEPAPMPRTGAPASPMVESPPAAPEEVEPSRPQVAPIEVKPTVVAKRRSEIVPPPEASAIAPSAAEPPAPTRSRGGEMDLLARAVASLASDPAKALAIAGDLERAYPDGMLQQERDVIAIKALVKLGDVERARSRLDQFRSRYPTSIHAAQLQSLVP